jgi:hypothetical protein
MTILKRCFNFFQIFDVFEEDRCWNIHTTADFLLSSGGMLPWNKGNSSENIRKKVHKGKEQLKDSYPFWMFFILCILIVNGSLFQFFIEVKMDLHLQERTVWEQISGQVKV